VLCAAAKAGGGGTQNGGYFTFDNQQRLLAEEAELDRMVKELQATLPPSEGRPDQLLLKMSQRSYLCRSKARKELVLLRKYFIMG